MIVYRLIKYEGEPKDIAEMFRLSIHGEYQHGGLKITAAPVEPRIVQSVPMLMHALQEVSGKRWTLPASTLRRASPLTMVNRSDDKAAAEFIRRIDDLLDDGFGWAADTLIGIREAVERTGWVTEGQRTAVDNIENARRD